MSVSVMRLSSFRPGLAHVCQAVSTGCGQQRPGRPAGPVPRPRSVGDVFDRRLAIDPGQEQAGQQMRGARFQRRGGSQVMHPA